MIVLAPNCIRGMKRLQIPALILLTTLLVLSPARAAKPGALDRSFGGNGKVSTNFGGYNAARDAVIDRHGRIVAVGHPASGGWGLARYRRNGDLDRTFSHNGKVEGGVPGNARAVTIDSHGRIVVAGGFHTCCVDRTSYLVLARYRPNGTLDDSFGWEGKVEAETGESETLVIDSEGRIVVPCYRDGDSGMTRYMPDGRLDPSLGTDCLVTTDGRFGADAIDSRGRFLAGGFVGVPGHPYRYDFAVSRYKADGTPDPSLDGDGLVTTHVGRRGSASSLTIDPEGRIIAAGYVENGRSNKGDFAVVRYRADGQLDAKFGDGGVVTTRFGRDHDDNAVSVALDSHRRIVVLGETQGSHSWIRDFALARYLPNGRLDRSFSRNGKVTTSFSGGSDDAYAVMVDSQDRIVAAGGGGRKDDFVLARYVGYPHRR
jgi:uncharacterized delta-60 repeat protein